MLGILHHPHVIFATTLCFTDEDADVKLLSQGHKLERSGIRVTIKVCLVEPSILSHLATENE